MTASMSLLIPMDSVSNGILNNNDPATVRAGTPAYLIMIDGLIDNDPEDVELLIAGSRLYGAYAAVFVEDKERMQRLADKAFYYARSAFCLEYETFCSSRTLPFDEFLKHISLFDSDDVPVVYAYAAAWAGKIQAGSHQWSTLADLPRVEALMESVVAADETFEQGQAHLYLGVIRSQLPPVLGGLPVVERTNFERAVELSRGRNFLAKVEVAKNYARRVVA